MGSQTRNGVFRGQQGRYKTNASDNELLPEDSASRCGRPEKQVEAHQHAKLRRVASQKLMEKGLEEEQTRLNELKRLLKEEFGKCLWDKCLEKQRGKGTTEDMYWWYKKQMGLTYTKSELQIRGIKL